MTNLSPAYDNKIVRKYSSRTIEHKLENKTSLQEEIGWVAEPKQPILCLPLGMTDTLGGTIVEEVLEGILDLQIGLLIRGKGSQKYANLFTKMAKDHPYKVKILPDTDVALRKMFAASDMALFLSKEEMKDILDITLRYGVVPIAPPCQGLENYNPVQESGNAFTYERTTPWQCFASIVRAVETFKFPFDWRTIERHAMESVKEEESA